MGVCWRLAQELQQRGHRVRLWTDQPGILQWMAPGEAAAVEVVHWADESPDLQPGDVVVEAFGCDLPTRFVQAMARAARPPVWINLEYLSAEPYVERSHGLASPQLSGPGLGLGKWFFYPGFSASTGGLLHEPGMMDRLNALDRRERLRALGVDWQPGQAVVTLFAYPQSPLESWLEQCAPNRPSSLVAQKSTPWLLVAQGPLQGRAQAWAQSHPGAPWRIGALPWLSQPQFDELLACSDWNIVRGEDSLVRAIWAGKPFIWHIYEQHDRAHEPKLQALLEQLLGSATPPDRSLLQAPLKQLWWHWNGLSPAGSTWPEWTPELTQAMKRTLSAWRASLLSRESLSAALERFVAQKQVAG